MERKNLGHVDEWPDFTRLKPHQNIFAPGTWESVFLE